jgi:hypothetical protein
MLKNTISVFSMRPQILANGICFSLQMRYLPPIETSLFHLISQRYHENHGQPSHPCNPAQAWSQYFGIKIWWDNPCLELEPASCRSINP